MRSLNVLLFVVLVDVLLCPLVLVVIDDSYCQRIVNRGLALRERKLYLGQHTYTSETLCLHTARPRSVT